MQKVRGCFTAFSVLLLPFTQHPPARPEGIAYTIPMIAGFLSWIAAFVTRAIAIVRKQEKSILVYISTIIGMGLPLWLLADIGVPL